MPRHCSWFALIAVVFSCGEAASAQQLIRTPEEMINEAYAQPNDQEILAALHRAVDVHPTHLYVHKQLGLRLLQTGDYEAAIPLLADQWFTIVGRRRLLTRAAAPTKTTE